MSRSFLVHVPGLVAGSALVAAAGLLPWPTAGFAVATVGYTHPPYVLVASLTAVAVVGGLVRWTDRTAFAALVTGWLVAVTSVGYWGTGRYYAIAGGVVLAGTGATGFFGRPDLTAADVSPDRSTLTPGGWVGFLAVVGVAVLFAFSGYRLGSTLIDYVGALLVSGCLVALGIAVCLYWWEPTVRRAVVLLVVMTSTFGPVALFTSADDYLVRGVGTVAIAGAWLAVGRSGLVDRALRASADADGSGMRRSRSGGLSPGTRSVSTALTFLGVVSVLVAGFLPWLGPSLTAIDASLGIERPVYFLTLSLVLAVVVINFDHWSPQTSRIAIAAGAAIPFVVKGSDPLAGGRFLAILGGVAIAFGGLLAYRFDNGLRFEDVSIRRPKPPVHGWIAFTGHLSILLSIAVVRVGRNPREWLFRDPPALEAWNRPIAEKVFEFGVILFDTTYVATIPLLVALAALGAAICLYRWDSDVALFVGLTGVTLLLFFTGLLIETVSITASASNAVLPAVIGSFLYFIAGALATID